MSKHDQVVRDAALDEACEVCQRFMNRVEAIDAPNTRDASRSFADIRDAIKELKSQ